MYGVDYSACYPIDVEELEVMHHTGPTANQGEAFVNKFEILILNYLLFPRMLETRVQIVVA